jgi:hypothetical protein
MGIWQDRVDVHGFASRYATVRRFVASLRATAAPEARVVITTAPGGPRAMCSYGEGPVARDPITEKYRRTRLFVLTLGFSRKCRPPPGVSLLSPLEGPQPGTQPRLGGLATPQRRDPPR